ncbi:Hypothetical predicted protein [Octopus vulgaris]|uniref:Secreted protein n=1 Tax=Octopus vulgaris TaxID=6645 RepID=A0AA36FQQ1_OCTVU|nr:Hypothetical predicted protein [Octopus vulgaris]
MVISFLPFVLTFLVSLTRERWVYFCHMTHHTSVSATTSLTREKNKKGFFSVFTEILIFTDDIGTKRLLYIGDIWNIYHVFLKTKGKHFREQI